MKRDIKSINSRRRTLLSAAAASLATGSLSAMAQSDIAQMTVGFPAGGPADFLARLIVDAGLGEAYGRRFIVDNRPGGGGLISTRWVARAAPDGNTVLMTPSFFLSNALVYDKPGYDPVKDFVPVAPIGSTYLVFAVNSNAPFKTLAEFVQDARQRGDAVSYGSPGAGTHGHLAGEALNTSAGLKMTHVPYRGDAAALQDLLGGQINCGFFAVGLIQQHAAAGKVRLLGVAAPQRMPEVPNVPSMKEAGADHSLYNVVGWFGLFLPAGTPLAISQRLAAALKVALDKPGVNKKLADFGISRWNIQQEEFAKILVRDLEIWRKVIQAANVRLSV